MGFGRWGCGRAFLFKFQLIFKIPHRENCLLGTRGARFGGNGFVALSPPGADRRLAEEVGNLADGRKGARARGAAQGDASGAFIHP